MSPATTPPATTPPATTPPTPVAVEARPLLDDLFGGFWTDRQVPARLPVLLGAIAVGVLAAVVLPFRDAGLGTFLVLVAAGGVILRAAEHRRDPFTLLCAALCVALAATTLVRDADWILVLCVLAGGLLCVAGVTRGRTLPGFLLSAISLPLAGLRGLPWLGRTFAVLTGLGNGAALLRTAIWSALLLLVFGALFVSADALVAEWTASLLPDVSIDNTVLRGFVTVAVGGTVLAASYLALNPPSVDRQPRDLRPVTHRFEWLAPVLVVNAVFGAFLIAQATVVFGGHDYLRHTTGLTYAAYVHQGFGQLTVATALTLLVIWAAARKAPRDTPADRLWLRLSLGMLCLQTLVVVASALHRMRLYQEAYGFTELRLLVPVFEGWLGLIVVAALGGGIALRARWLPRFALISGVVALLGIAAINPDAWIAERNIERYQETGKVDWLYLQELSADAVPTLATELPAELESCGLGLGRWVDGNVGASADDWLEWNLGRQRAAEYLSEATVPDFAFDGQCPSAR